MSKDSLCGVNLILKDDEEMGFGITQLPGRKHPSIYVTEGSRMWIVGPANNPEHTETLSKFINILCDCSLVKVEQADEKVKKSKGV